MERLVKTLPYLSLKDPECFKRIRVEEKAICWDTGISEQTLIPLRLTVDNILFAIRDSE
jgi:hypothetical protein